MSSTEEQVETGLPVADEEQQVEKSAITSSEDDVQLEANEKPKINLKNWLNLGAYILNIVFTFGIGTNGWFGNGTNGELSQKYQVRVRKRISCTCVSFNMSSFSRSIQYSITQKQTHIYRLLSLPHRMHFVFGFSFSYYKPFLQWYNSCRGFVLYQCFNKVSDIGIALSPSFKSAGRLPLPMKFYGYHYYSCS